MFSTCRTRRRRTGATLIALIALAVLAALGPAAAGAQAASLTIAVQTDPAGDTTPFPSTSTSCPGRRPGPFEPQPPADLTLTPGTPQTFNVHKGKYTVTAQMPAGFKLVDIVCESVPPDPAPADAFIIDLPGHRVGIELSGAESKSCTFVARKQAVLRIVKRTDPAGAAAAFAFHPGASLGAADFTLGDGQSTQFDDLDPGSYDVTEQPLAGWTLRSAACDDGDSVVSGSTATAMLAAGEVVTCTFTNALTPTPAPQPPAAVAPAAAVKAVQPRRGAAALIAPTRCVESRFTVAVVGAPVRTVSWYVNGRRVRTTKARSGQRRFTVHLPVGARVQVVTARVAFANNTSPRTRTLQATVRRCAAKRVRPKFTG